MVGKCQLFVSDIQFWCNRSPSYIGRAYRILNYVSRCIFGVYPLMEWEILQCGTNYGHVIPQTHGNESGKKIEPILLVFYIDVTLFMG
jgi:hypothetical protein